MLNVRTKSLIHYHFIVFIFGFTSILAALISISAIPLVWYRMMIASGGLALFFWFFNRESVRIPRKLVPTVFFAGIVIALHWITFFHAIKIAGVSLTLSMMSTGAFITALLEPIFFKRKFFFYEFFFGGLAVLGVSMIFNAELEHAKGILIALLSAFLSVIFTLINGKMVQKAPSITLSFYELLFGWVALSLYLLFTNSFHSEAFQLLPMDFVWLFILSLVCTAYAFHASIKVMKNLTPFTVMMIINMEPVYGIILSLIVFGERELMSMNFYIGLTIILLAIACNGLFKLQKQLKEKRTKPL